MAKEYMAKNIVFREYDEEWVTLIKEAKQSGLSLEEVRTFLNQGYDAESTANQDL